MGIWIGTTRDDEAAHLWRIVQRGDEVIIYFAYDLQSEPCYFHMAHIVDGILRVHSQPPVDVVFVDAQHFVVPNWDDVGDMLFSREGVAELSATSAWARYDAGLY